MIYSPRLRPSPSSHISPVPRGTPPDSPSAQPSSLLRTASFRDKPWRRRSTDAPRRCWKKLVRWRVEHRLRWAQGWGFLGRVKQRRAEKRGWFHPTPVKLWNRVSISFAMGPKVAVCGTMQVLKSAAVAASKHATFLSPTWGRCLC